MRPRNRLALAALVSVGLLTSACEEEPVDAASAVNEAAANEAASGEIWRTLGRVHLVLQPRPDELEPEPELQISGRFVEYRGATEEFVRARADLAVSGWDRLDRGQCVASEQLQPQAEIKPDTNRELSLVDAGDLRVTLGRRELVVPLVLKPDILPYLSGVEYIHVDDRLPNLDLAPDGTAPVSFSIDGAPEVGIEPFTIQTRIPAALELQAASLSGDELRIDWRPPGARGADLLLQLQAFASQLDEPVGEQVTCLVADNGRAALELDALASAGLAVGESRGRLRVSASRFVDAEVDTGEFGPVEISIELRDQEVLSLGRR